MTVSNLYPTSSTSLTLDFAKTKRLSPLITFTRSTTGTFVDKNGILQTAAINQPRFDHNPATLQSLGLLVEEARTNLLLRSEEFDNASWALLLSASLSANQAVAPNGTLSADQLTISDSSSFSGVRQNYTFLASTTYTFSVWVRAVTGTASFRLKVYDGTADTFSANQSATETWQRYTLTMTTAAGAGAGNIAIANIVSPLNQQNIYIWGAQLEAGAFPTSYIPTTDTTATRNADVCTITGSNFSRWYRQDEGTFLIQVSSASEIGSGRFARWLELSNGSSAEQLSIFRYGAGRLRTTLTTSSVSQAAFDTGGDLVAGSPASCAVGLQLNNVAVSTSNNGFSTDSSASMAALNGMTIGDADAIRTTATNNNGTISRLTYWPRRLPDSVLQTITK